MSVLDLAMNARDASLKLQGLSEEMRLTALAAISKALLSHADEILNENKKDLADAKINNLSSAMFDRLTLTEKNIHDLSAMCIEVANQKQVVGMIVESHTRPDGLLVQKQRIPIGVIGMIFESRPNVVVDGAALAIKSGNAIILKGGKEAQHSNRKLFEIIHNATASVLPMGSISLIETREDVAEILKLNKYIDLMVPRGGSALINYVKANATMPVVAHDKGLCHLYVHSDCNVDAIAIILNAKTQRPGVCNALETLILNENYPKNEEIFDALKAAAVELKYPATEEDYATEWLDKKISIKMVKTHLEAIEHIKKYSSHHTEAILATDPEVIEEFMNSLDASCIVINASTRFNDGGELGLGAELGISTSKLHAYGPMGAAEMTATRFIVTGNGHIRK
ncbi:glutamate-5-semialdehyde dehydrogenase [Bacteriovorax sp. PP10]|uniref:Gamma-glutamyl phosphate reductase n=1 Tax=Bacteriovorax antarcticus TaxID=3088717 RepID=A0ABU5VQN5_9BACT|nr:glutamate-5-semialdehyde dehydrogenase [Bacteriovorax sp. PP10]MEA9355344.1 glutamate-5-semialdehyde dehydrogenase [Bacteriovorax sp. PP10]